MQGKNVNVSSKTVTLVPNPKYWGAQPKLARIVYVNIGSDSDTNVKALQNQEVNMIYPQPQLDIVKNLQGLPGVTTSINFGPAFEHFDFNTRDPLLAHKEVRQAFAYALDRPTLVKSTVGKFSDKATVDGSHLLVASQDGYQDNGTAYAQADVAKAKSLLEGIGATMGSDGYYSLNGKELSFKVRPRRATRCVTRPIALAAQMEKKAGIKLTEDADAEHLRRTSPSRTAGGRWLPDRAVRLGRRSGTLVQQLHLQVARRRRVEPRARTTPTVGDPGVDKALTAMAAAPDTASELKDANDGRQAAVGRHVHAAAVPEAHVAGLRQQLQGHRGQPDSGRSVVEQRRVLRKRLIGAPR